MPLVFRLDSGLDLKEDGMEAGRAVLSGGRCAIAYLNPAAWKDCSPAIRRVIIDHSGGLHEGIHGGGADEVESGFFQGFAHRIGFRGFRGVIGYGFRALALCFLGRELPEKLHGIGELQPCAGVLTEGENFSSVADDAGIC